jgi:hypothetical protein
VNRIGIGVIGCGFVGRGAHVPVPIENLVHAPLPLPVGSAAIDRPEIATGDRQLG